MSQESRNQKTTARIEESYAERMEEIVNCQNEEEFIPNLGQDPPPVPPKTTKDTLYSERGIADLFDDLEQFAINIDSENVTFPVLMKQLNIWKLTDLEKVRVLFHWISSQDLNAIIFPDQLIPNSPLDQLKSIREGTSNYPLVFQQLCRAAGIHCKVIKGYKKCASYNPDHSFSADPYQRRGTWNAVFINNEWRFIDTHWGARCIDETTGVIKYKFDQFWFLTDPDQFISTHYPDESAWQLLHHPITLAQFEASVLKNEMFYKLKLELSSHQNGMIRTDESGFVRVTLKNTTARNDIDFSWTLQEKAENGLQGEMTKSVNAHKNSDEIIFEIRLPHPGQYILTLYCGSSADVCSETICEYQVDGSMMEATQKLFIQL